MRTSVKFNIMKNEYEVENDYVKTPSGFWHRIGDGFSVEAEEAGEKGDKSYEEYEQWAARQTHED
jgi:hypothetical protein